MRVIRGRYPKWHKRRKMWPRVKARLKAREI
jgi:hypothetical protein